MKHCLIIDDEDQKDEIFILQSKAKEQQFPIECYFFNLSSREVQREEIRNGKPDTVIDFEKVLEELKRLFDDQEIDLIACDYKYNIDSTQDGLKLVKFLKENMFKGKKMPYLLYSSKSKEIEEKLQSEVKELIDDRSNLKQYLEAYFETNPEKIIKRGNYDDSIIEYLKRNKTDLRLKLGSKLLKNPDRVFDNIFPRFNGKTLSQLAKLLEDRTEESDDFESEFLDRSVSHFIYLEE
jgi:hypothetical protein